jgi:hypothetical protein
MSAAGDAPPVAAAPVPAWSALRDYFLDFRVLADCPREYWIIQVINLVESLAYFAFLNIGVVFLSENLGFSDVHECVLALHRPGELRLLVAVVFRRWLTHGVNLDPVPEVRTGS